MRVLGPSTPLSAFRWDLIYLLAQLGADDSPGVPDLAPPIQDALAQLAAEHDALTDAQDASVIALALLHKRDSKRDRLLVALGGVARATARDIYKRLFPRRSPTRTARLGIAAQSAEIRRILGELATLDADHPLRLAYESALQDAEAALLAAKTHVGKAQTALALQRSRIEHFKRELDALRLATLGKLVSLLHDKAEADAFFRPTTSPPDEATTTTLTTPAVRQSADPARPLHNGNQ